MIEIENVVVAAKGIDAVWTFLSDIGSITACVPTVVGYRLLDENTVSCDLRVQLGLIALDSKATVAITRREPNRLIEVSGHTEPGDSLKKYGKLLEDTATRLRITTGLEALDAAQTQIHFCIQARAVGQLKRVYDAIIKGQRSRLESQFIANLAKGLGAKVTVAG